MASFNSYQIAPLIEDHSSVIDLATQLLDLGYYPIPTGGGEDGKGWLKPRSGMPTWHPNSEGAAPPQHDVITAFDDNKGCGLSVAAKYLRPPYNNDLFPIDVDVDDPTFVQMVADIIGSPCPARYGSRGMAFFVRYPQMKKITTLLNERNLQVPAWCKDAKIKVPAYTGKNSAIDLLSYSTASHIIIPPTRHILASQDQGKPVHYRWVEFPGTKHILPLHTTAPGDLPELQPYHLLLLYQLAKNPTSALFGYLGQSSPGNHHMLMLAASTYMWNERFDQEEIIEICETEAYKSSTDDQNFKDRCEEIRIAIRSLPNRMPNQKPANQSQPKKAPQSKTPLAREIADYLRNEHFGYDNLGAFSGLPYHWRDGAWHMLVELGHTNTWTQVYNIIYEKYHDADHKIIQSAISALSSTILTREAAPNHDFIPFANGLLDIHSMELHQMERDDYILSSLKYDWKPDAKCPLWDNFMQHLFTPPEEVEEVLQREADKQLAVQCVEEFFGYCLVRSHQFQKMLYVIGMPNTGKSVLFKVLGGLLPKHWMSQVAMDTLGDPNSRMQMSIAHVNLASEVGRKSRDVDDILLRVTAGEHVEAKLLYKDRIQIVLPARLVFQGNLPPDTTDSTGAMQRRMLMLRSTDILPVHVNNFENLLLKEAEGILARLARAYARLLDRGYFVPPTYSSQIIEDQRIEANSTVHWMEQYCTKQDKNKADAEFTVNQELYNHYSEWCQQNGMKPFSSPHWGRFMSMQGCPSIKKKLPGNHMVYGRYVKLNTNTRVNY